MPLPPSDWDQWDRSVGLRAGAFVTLRQAVNENWNASIETPPSLSPEKKEQLATKRLKEKHHFKIAVLGFGMINKTIALDLLHEIGQLRAQEKVSGVSILKDSERLSSAEKMALRFKLQVTKAMIDLEMCAVMTARQIVRERQ